MEQETWEPTEPGDLKIGDYIRIDQRWFDHPFERRFMRISSDRELGIIRDKQLTRIFVDRARAEEGAGGPAAAAAQAAAPAVDATPPADAPASAAPAEAAVEVAETLVVVDPAAEAAKEAKLRAEQRTALEGAKARDRHTRERAHADAEHAQLRQSGFRGRRGRIRRFPGRHPQQQHFATGADVARGAAGTQRFDWPCWAATPCGSLV